MSASSGGGTVRLIISSGKSILLDGLEGEEIWMSPSWRARGSRGEDQVRRVMGSDGEVLVRVSRRVGGEREEEGWEMERERGMRDEEDISEVIVGGSIGSRGKK